MFFLKAANHSLLHISESRGVNCDTVPSCHGLFWREKFCNKIRVSKLFFKKQRELCSRTNLHSMVPLTQGTVPGTSF